MKLANHEVEKGSVNFCARLAIFVPAVSLAFTITFANVR